MFQSAVTALGVSHPMWWLAQVIIERETPAPENAALVFSGPQFFTALISGVVLAFAFQLLLTNLGVAAGISLSGSSSSTSSNHDHENHSLGGTIRKIGLAVGLGTLISVTIALFFACLFAVKLSLLATPALGAIVGLVIWATYFCLLVWVSSTTVGSLIGSVVNTATSGFQAIWGTAAAALGAGVASKQVVNTAEAAAAAVRRELGSAIDPETIHENVQEYLEALRPPELNLQQIRSEFENLLQDPSLSEIAGSDSLRKIDRQTFVDLVSSRSDLSQRDVNRIANELETAWNKTVGQLPQKDMMSEFVDYLKSATPGQLLGDELSQKLDSLVEELRKRRHAQSSSKPVSQAMTTGFNSLVGLVMGRTDLSDLDVEKIVSQLQKLKDQLGQQSSKIAAQVRREEPKPYYSPVQVDMENYLLHKYSWQMNSEVLEREFRDLLYDPEADPSTVAEELEQLDRSYFADLLQQRGVFTQEKIHRISNLLETIRLEVLAVAQAAQEREESIALFAEVEDYLLNTPKEALTPERIELNFREILEDPDANSEQLSTRLAQFDRPTWERLLEQRRDMSAAEAEVVIFELERTRDRVLLEGREMQEVAKAKAEAQWLKVKSHLRDTGKTELNPDAIERELKLLVDDPQAGLLAIRERVSRFDRDTLVQLLSQRQDLSEQQINRVIDQVERNWTRVRYTPRRLGGKAKDQYEQVSSAIAQYLRDTGKAELNPEGIRRDLSKLLEDPQTGAKAIRRRLAAMDRDTLVQLLSQRDDLSEAQVNQVIDEVLSTLRSLARAPRRLASRAQLQVQDFQSAIADYLRSTDKEELNPEAIKRDVQVLLHDPRAGMEGFKERLSHLDRSTLVALLSQREDISEEEVNRIINQIIAVRDQVILQLRSLQQRIQSVIDQIFAKIRDYLNSLERPELNYEGIKHDIRTLFDDPEAGFDALRDRLSQFDRDTLVAIMSSRQDISEADANRVIDQIESTRNRVLQRAERLQRDTQLRLEEVKLQAQRQVEETRKAAAVASWWLFFTALVSAAASAGAGAIGVVD
ncbi:MFS transporter [Lyngbya aestuarii]|uniref:MFS transporter n=1 Tax=Lyngbya aestuarii TaxID=118322 RepID=UPI00403DDE2B